MCEELREEVMLEVEEADHQTYSEKGARRRREEAELCLPEQKMKPALSA